MQQYQQNWLLLLVSACFVSCVEIGAAGNVARKHNDSNGHEAADADAETFNKTEVNVKSMPVQKGKVDEQSHKPISERKSRVNNALNTIGKLLKTNPLKTISNTIKNVINQNKSNKKSNKKGANKARASATIQSNNGDSGVTTDAQPPETGTKLAGVVVDGGKSANQSGNTGEEFPAYGGDYSNVDESPVIYEDNPTTPPKKGKKQGGKKKKKHGKFKHSGYKHNQGKNTVLITTPDPAAEYA
ncbi:uncharacterized protein LOC132193501 [Neocloeon triangulifer]|uniref:uncharacterized protein LOC132193501 n=1 Tax=Neocloeon triangulifer TaxID=2078957 RepID=UPI00286F5791|nr:uncharacterized protein LOC132193501 [Neocloeon triangulifer]